MEPLTDSEDNLSILLHRAQSVRNLRSQQGWEVLQDYALHKTDNDRKRLLNGQLGSYEQYLELTSFFKGIEFVLSGAEAELERLAQGMRGRLDGLKRRDAA